MPQDREPRGQVGGPQVVQHLDHAAMRGAVAHRPAGDLDHHIVAIVGAMRLPRAHLHRIPVGRILGLDPAGAAAGPEHAADVRGGILGAPDEPRNPATAVVHAHGQYFHPVVVHQRGGVGPRQHQRRRTIIRNHEHIAVGTAAHAAGHPLALARDGEAVRALDGLPVAHHGGQALGQRLALPVGVDTQPFGKPHRGQRLGRLG